MADLVHLVYIERDLEFSVFLKNADGTAYVIPAGAQYRFRLFSKPGVVVVDLPFGSGTSVGSFSGGRIDINGGTITGLSESNQASGEIIRSDTGADVIGAAWPIRLARPGETRASEAGGPVINVDASSVSFQAPAGFGGAPGPQGPAGPSVFASGAVPYLYNGGFDLWGLGASGFGAASEIIGEGWRFLRGTGSGNSLSRIAGLVPDTQYACLWNRTAAGTTDSVLQAHIEDLRQFHNKTVTFAWEDSGGAVDYSTRILRRFGTGGSATSAVSGASFTAGGATTPRSQAFAVGDLSAAVITDDSSLEFWFWRRITNADGVLRLSRLRMFVGTTDYGYVKPDPALAAAAARRRLQRFTDRTINGTKRVYFPPMRVAPSVTASVGTVSNIREGSLDLAHNAAADVTITLDAEY